MSNIDKLLREHGTDYIGAGDIFTYSCRYYFHCGHLDRFGNFHKHGPFLTHEQAVKVRDRYIAHSQRVRPGRFR